MSKKFEGWVAQSHIASDNKESRNLSVTFFDISVTSPQNEDGERDLLSAVHGVDVDGDRGSDGSDEAPVAVALHDRKIFVICRSKFRS